MKKAVALLLAAVMFIALTACEINFYRYAPVTEQESAAATTQESTAAAAQESTAAPAQESTAAPAQESSTSSTQESSSSPAQGSSTSPTLDAKIRDIRSWYYDFSSYPSEYEKYSGWEGHECFQKTSGFIDLAMVRYRSGIGPDGSCTREIYYCNGEPYFVYQIGANGDNDELRLYFWDGELIRWIEKDGVVHDSSNEYYQSYYDIGLAEYKEWKSQTG